MGRLYHYTTPEALIGIFRNRCLWATNALFLNDSQEVAHGIELARRKLRSLRDCASDDAQGARIDWLVNEIRNVGTATSKFVFVCSLSADGDMLSQWRAYCRGGGFAVGFPESELGDAIASQQFALDAVVYEDEKQAAQIDSVLDSIVVPWIRGAGAPVSDDDDRFKVSGTFVWELLRVGAKLKNSSFSEERESRIVSLPELKYDPEKLYFRARSGLVVPYIEINLPEQRVVDFWSRVEIIIGPTRYPRESHASVYDLVRRFQGHAVAIRDSRIPFREW